MGKLEATLTREMAVAEIIVVVRYIICKLKIKVKGFRTTSALPASDNHRP